mmetsp:Transcript_43961/g.116185  ORF Transcript_43961/g.116185 Transcript_43961/m.116185 type:complete len:718 (+) Transcript_43961:28-2181(+)
MPAPSQVLGWAVSAVVGDLGYSAVERAEAPAFRREEGTSRVLAHFREVFGEPSVETRGEAEARFLQQQQCNVEELFSLFVPEPIRKYNQCFATHDADQTRAGARMHAHAECWCDHNITDYIQPLGCCTPDKLADHCSLKCGADLDCESAAAKTCLDECPAICLEDGYAPETCNFPTAEGGCDAGKCFPYLLCITAAGQQSSDRYCDDESLDADALVKEYFDCMNSYSHRNMWKHSNAARYCACKVNLKEAFDRHHCCSHRTLGPICQYECEPDPPCGGTAAETCETECEEKCKYLAEYPSEDCKTHCLKVDAPCHKYSVCEPSQFPDFASQYICDDGSEPHASGCCLTTLPQTCPADCSSSKIYRLQGNTSVHYECECLGCRRPGDVMTEEQIAALRRDLEEGSTFFLWQVSRYVGLEGAPSEEMERLVQEYAKAIEDLYRSTADEEVRRREHAKLEEKYSPLIVEAARAEAELRRAVGAVFAEGGSYLVDPETQHIVMRFDVNLCVTSAANVAPCRDSDAFKFEVKDVGDAMEIQASNREILGVPSMEAGARAMFAASFTDPNRGQWRYDPEKRSVALAQNLGLCLSGRDGVLTLQECNHEIIWQRFGGPSARGMPDRGGRRGDGDGGGRGGVIAALVVGLLLISCGAFVVVRKYKQRATVAERAAASAQQNPGVSTGTYGPEVVMGRAVDEVPEGGDVAPGAAARPAEEEKKPAA